MGCNGQEYSDVFWYVLTTTKANYDVSMADEKNNGLCPLCCTRMERSVFGSHVVFFVVFVTCSICIENVLPSSSENIFPSLASCDFFANSCSWSVLQYPVVTGSTAVGSRWAAAAPWIRNESPREVRGKLLALVVMRVTYQVNDAVQATGFNERYVENTTTTSSSTASPEALLEDSTAELKTQAQTSIPTADYSSVIDEVETTANAILTQSPPGGRSAPTVTLPTSGVVKLRLSQLQSPIFRVLHRACVSFSVQSFRFLSNSDHLQLWAEQPADHERSLLWSTYGSSTGRWQNFNVGLSSGTHRLVFTGAIYLERPSNNFFTAYRIDRIQLENGHCHTHDNSCERKAPVMTGESFVEASPYSNQRCLWIKSCFEEIPVVSITLNATLLRRSHDFIMDVTHVSASGFHVCVARANHSSWEETDVVLRWAVSTRSEMANSSDGSSGQQVTLVPATTHHPRDQDARGRAITPTTQECEEFTCVSRECVPVSRVCDGIFDCASEDDENCGNVKTLVFSVASAATAVITAVLVLWLFVLRIRMLEDDPYSDDFNGEYRRYVELLEQAMENTRREERAAKEAARAAFAASVVWRMLHPHKTRLRTW